MDPLGVLFLPIFGRSGQSPVLRLTEDEGKKVDITIHLRHPGPTAFSSLF